jgi:ABC-2 type transport system permease protein
VVVFPLAFALFFGTVLEGAIERASPGPLPPGQPSGFVRSLPTGVLWGLMSSAATFAVAMVSERTRGTLHRLRAAPTSDGALLAGKALACWVTCLFVAALLVAVAVIGFGARVDRPLALALAVCSAATGFVGITVLLGVTGKSEQSVAGAGWAVLLACAMLGGAMVPTSLMPEWLQRVGEASPVRWGLSALETALFRAGDFGALWRDCLRLALLGVAGIGLAALVLRRTARA